MLKTRNEDGPLDRILRRAEVERATGLSRATIYAHVAAGTFPPPVKITTKSVGWRESAIRAWLASRHASPLRENADTCQR